MKNMLTLLTCSFILNACVMTPPFLPRETLNVSYMQTGDAIKDAQSAIANNDFTLIGFDQRGLKVPGIKNVGSLSKNCPVLRLNGMGDVVKDKQHLQQMQSVHTYSLKYNQQILNVTTCQQ